MNDKKKKRWGKRKKEDIIIGYINERINAGIWKKRKKLKQGTRKQAKTNKGKEKQKQTKQTKLKLPVRLNFRSLDTVE